MVMTEEKRDAIAFNVLYWRAYRGLSQNELAFKADVPLATIMQIENASDKVKDYHLSKLASAFGIEEDKLLKPLPKNPGSPDSDETILKRMNDPKEDFVDCDAFMKAMDERDGGI